MNSICSQIYICYFISEMKIRDLISSLFLRGLVLTGYIIAIVVGSGLHIHVESAELLEHSHSSSGSHSHDPHNTDDIQHDAADVHDARHNHPLAEFDFTATRIKDGSESIIPAHSAFVAIWIPLNACSTERAATPLCEQPDVLLQSCERILILPGRAPPLA
jgi:hypothetical protein